MVVRESATLNKRSTAFPTESRWGATSETGLLTDVLLSAPAHLAMIPCNAVTVESLSQGLLVCPLDAVRQHRAFTDALGQAGVRCHFLTPRKGMPDLSFTRDAVLMSPWGLVELRPNVAHRRAEVTHAAATVRALGVPFYARVEQGTVEGGDICMVRDRLILIGYSDERTDRAGGKSLGRLFAERGWEVIYVRFEPNFLHLDTILTMVADDCAVVLTDALDGAVLARLRDLGIELVPATLNEVKSLSANFLSLGRRRVVAAQGGGRLASKLNERGIQTIEVAIDQFTRCGGGPHCLTMPLARQSSM